uniref:Macaca fascicularis brain cDNA, clone: QtrA-16705 n=1 Tax=Macaca fascicularis TaxID=9541 RepID=I7GHW3_MACFA|nr:unnamed protein product [Macaca fascicularis]
MVLVLLSCLIIFSGLIFNSPGVIACCCGWNVSLPKSKCCQCDSTKR